MRSRLGAFHTGMRFVRFLALGVCCLLGAVAMAWAAGALYFDLPVPSPARTLAALGWVLGGGALCVWGRRRGRLLLALGFVLLVGGWLSLRPRQDRDWQPQVAVLAYATREEDQITVHNVRSFEYRSVTEFSPHYNVRTYDLSALRGLDLFIDYWGSPFMDHPTLSFDFGPQGHLCFSIETRPERGEAYSAIGGLYRQFELIYVAADERDVVRLRTNFKAEDLYLYPLAMTPEGVRVRFFEYLHRLNALPERPAWYNAVTSDCTTRIRAQHPAAVRLS